MKFNSQICTTREQSERLLSLGLKKETADMTWVSKSVDWGGLIDDGLRYWHIVARRVEAIDISVDTIPAWSFSRLLEIYLMSGEYRNILFVNKEYSFEYLVRHVEVYIKAGYIDENYLTEDYGTRELQD